MIKAHENILPQDGVLIYRPNFYSSEESELIFKVLEKNVAWKSDKIRMFGKEMDLPRLTAWYGDEGTDYKYSGILNRPTPWSSELLSIKEKVEKVTNENFNSLLLNFYRSGKDHVSWHADDERSLGENPFIASVSFGDVRTFQLKHKKDSTLPTISLELESGSLVIMSGEIQRHWIHRIVPTKKLKGPRINLTFRHVYN